MTTKRRGRPPSAGMRKASAEYQRAYRERKKQMPTEDKVAHFSITGSVVNELDAIAAYFELSRAKAVNDLLVSTLSWILPIFAKTAVEIDENLKLFIGPPDAETISKIKSHHWKALTASIFDKDEHNETSSISNQI